MLASGNHLVGCQVEATVQTASTDAALYRPGEPVSDPRQGLDPRGFGFSEGLADLGDGIGEHVVDRGPTFPDRVEQLLAVHHFVGMAKQARQDLLGLLFEFDQQAAHPQLPARLVELGSARSEEHTSELQSLMRISYAVFCLKKKT